MEEGSQHRGGMLACARDGARGHIIHGDWFGFPLHVSHWSAVPPFQNQKKRRVFVRREHCELFLVYSSVLPLLSLSEIGNEGTRASRKGSFGQMHLLIALGPGVARVSKDKLDCQGDKCEGCYCNLKSWGLCGDRGRSWRLVAERIWG